MVAETSLKRRHSTETESDSEQEDVCDGLIGSPLSHNSSDSGCFNTARKKRRGLIEKRRRDRINRSLNDLKNLIPTAHERQASAKLEKSEVLSLAVDHIKSLTAKLECANPQNLALDYRSIGYRECIGDVISYLVHGEGLGPSNHLHARLASHMHHQLSVHDQAGLPSTRYCSPPTFDSVPQPYHNTSPTTSYGEPVTICKPEPPISPSYCTSTAVTSAPITSAAGPPVQYNTYPQYNTDCLHATIPPSADNVNLWPQANNGSPIDSESPLFPYAPQSSWV